MDHDLLRSTYKFDYLSNSLAIETACYSKDDDQLFSVSSKRMGMKKSSENDTFICVEVSNTKISSSIIKPETGVPSSYKDSDTFNKVQNDLGSFKGPKTNGYQNSDLIYMAQPLSNLLSFRHDLSWRLLQYFDFRPNFDPSNLRSKVGLQLQR